MFELKKVSGSTYYFDLPVKVGVYNYSGNDVVIIDSGSSSSYAKRIFKIINDQGFNITAIFNTHCHSDHVGGNAYIFEQTGCEIYCPDLDCSAVRYPILNQVLLTGSYPPSELNNKLFLAKASNAKPLTSEVLPEGLEIIDLKGHSLGMVGYKTRDNVYFLADSVVSAEILQKYFITYLISPSDYLNTLDYIEKLPEGIYIPSHVEKTTNIKSVVNLNRKYVHDAMTEILRFCETQKRYDEIVAHIFNINSVPFNVSQFELIGSTVRSYLAYLEIEQKLNLITQNNIIYYKTK